MPGIVGVQGKFVVYGTLASGAQDVSYGVWCNIADVDFIGQAALDTITDTVAALFDTFHDTSSVAAFYSSTDQFVGVKSYAYFTDSTSADLQSSALFAAPRAGSGTANHPKETSLVVSERTNQPGRSGRGRFYLPACGIALTAGGLVASSTAVDDLGDAAITLFDALSAALAIPVVASFTKGQTYNITRLEIDNKPDTQRRRQDKVLATHTFTEDL